MTKQITDQTKALRCVQQDGLKLFECCEDLKNDFIVASVAIQQNFEAIGAVGHKLLLNKDFIDLALDLVAQNAIKKMWEDERKSIKQSHCNNNECQD